MESISTPNDFLGSNTFISLAVLAIVAIGLILRLTFRSRDSEYKHDPKD